MARDFYSELGIARGASADEVRKAYRGLAAKLHPDKNQDTPGAEDRFKRLNQAFHVLSDDKKRKLYDEFGEDGLREGFDPNMARAYGGRGPSMEDVFRRRGGGGGPGGPGIGDLFGDLFGGGRRRPQKSPDMESEISIEFTSAVRGAELELALSRGTRTVKVRIPAGAQDGDRLRVPGAGSSQFQGMPAGDLLLTVRVKPHPHFTRDGLDLTVDLPVSVGEAFSGAKVEVPTPTGPVQLKIPPRTQSGQLLRLREKGVTRGKKTGDLYVRFLVRLPVSDDPAVLNAVQVLADATTEDLRGELAF